MQSERYFSENPIRLLDISSNLSYPELRRRAETTHRAVQVGLAPPSAREEDFGGWEGKDIVSLVRALATDPRRRTLYRILWPGRGDDQDSSDPELSLEQAHLAFVDQWVNFLVSGRAVEYSNALQRWAEFANVTASQDRFVKLLGRDGDVLPSNAATAVDDAFKEVQAYLLSRGAEKAADLWEAGLRETAEALIEAILDSPFNAEAEEAALSPIVNVGARLMSHVEAIVGVEPDYVPGESPKIPEKVAELQALIDILEARHPVIASWQEACDRWHDAACISIRKFAISLSDEDRDEAALSVMQSAQFLACDPELLAVVSDDILTIRKNIFGVDIDHSSIPLKPVRKAPPLRTVNGCGFKLYGSRPYPDNPQIKMPILYFTLGFVPVLPVGRYVAASEGNHWRFFATAPWTKGMKAHFALATALLIYFGWFYGVQTSSYTPPQREPISASAPESPAPTPSSDEQISSPVASDPRTQRLNEELNVLRSENMIIELTAGKDGESIDRDSKALDAEGARVKAMSLKNSDQISKAVAAYATYKKKLSNLNKRIDDYNKIIHNRDKNLNREAQILKALGESSK